MNYTLERLRYSSLLVGVSSIKERIIHRKWLQNGSKHKGERGDGNFDKDIHEQGIWATLDR